MMVHSNILKLVPTIHPRIWFCVLLGVLAAATAVAQGFLLARVIDSVFQGKPINTLTSVLVWIVALIAVQAILLWAKRWAELWISAGVKIHLRQRLLEKLYSLGPGYTMQQGGQEALSSTVDGVEAMEGYFGKYLPQVLITAIVPTLILGYLFFVDIWVASLVLIAIVLALFAPKMFEKLLGEYGKTHWDAYTQLNQKFVNTMQGMTTLQAFNAAERWGHELSENSSHLYRSTMKQLAISMLSSGIVSLAMKIGSAVALGVAALRTIQGHLDFETLVLTLFLVNESVRPLSALDQAWHAGYMGISASTGIQSILDQPAQTLANGTQPVPRIETSPALTVNDLSYTYPGKTVAALKDLSLELAPGKTTALVGASGSGKTTLVSLLLRFFDQQEGTVTIENATADQIELTAWRALFSVVSQDTYLFYGTIAENLRIAKPEATQQELERAAQQAQIHTFLEGLPLGYETVVGERGHALSGGQRQRIAIARAFLKDAPILILDEATASVDAANEQGIQATLERITADRTTLVIAHRLNTISRADHIYVLDQGSVTEQGTHQHLLAQHGTYAKLYALESKSA